MNWVDLLGADGVTVVGLLLVCLGVIGTFYIRLLNRFVKSLEGENEALHQAILRRDEDERDVIRETGEKLSQMNLRLDHADRDRGEIKQLLQAVLRMGRIPGGEI